MRFLLDEFPHKLLAFLIVQDDDLDPFGLQMILTPTNVLFSAMTTRATLYRMQAPVHMSQGLSEVYIVEPL